MMGVILMPQIRLCFHYRVILFRDWLEMRGMFANGHYFQACKGTGLVDVRMERRWVLHLIMIDR
jgi:hypothetical protein